MRLHRLEVEGFGPFRARQVVDFDAFAEDGIFLIAGRTGAGKSSILDAVCFALYGGVPRYETGEKRLRSDHSEPGDRSEVVVEFSTTAGRYRVTRSPEYERPAKRGGGMTKEPPKVALDEWTSDGWAGVAARAVDVGNELKDILQLSQEQFLQVILLAQNRFARFLLADSKERQQLLRRLFGTERFEDYQRRFDDRRRESELAVGTRRAAVSAQLDQADGLVVANELSGDDEGGDEAPSLDERFRRLERARARSAYRVEQTATERDAAETVQKRADETLAAITSDRDAQRERDRARARLDELDAARPQIAALRETLAAARAAESLRAIIAADRKASAALEAAADRAALRHEERTSLEASLGSGVGAAGFDPEPPSGADEAAADPLAALDPRRLREDASALTRASGEWKRAADLEAELPQRARRRADAEAAVDAAAQRIAEIEEERGRIPARLDQLRDEREPLRRDAEQSEARARQSAEAASRHAAAVEAAGLSGAVDGAERDRAATTAAHGRAVTTHAGLLQRRLDGMAGELAESLVDGEPCAVCGAIEHPAPAVHGDPVTSDDIAAAEQERERAAAEEHAAAERLGALRVSLAAAQERSGGRDVVTAEAERAAALLAQEESSTAAARVVELDGEIARLEARRVDLEAARETAASVLAEARQSQALLVEQAEADARDIETARGGFPTVAERIHAVTARIHAATALADALDEQSAAAKGADETATALAADLAASAFADVRAAEEALLSPAQQSALDEQITDHAAADKKERAVLLDLELRTLPEEPIDLVPLQQASEEARAAWRSAVSRATQAASAAQQLDEILARATAEHAASAALAAEHDVIEALAQTIAGRGANTYRMNLETFVLAAELEEIVGAANLRLREMSAGRYQLRHTDSRAARNAASGLGIIVFDAFTGQTRPAQSLSGGETFLSSLALALGLAEVVTARAGGIRLDTLFIDEGFGSLDADTLDVAMRTLDELRQGGRTVGVISHVEAMQEQIPAQLTVRTTPDGPSVIDAD